MGLRNDVSLLRRMMSAQEAAPAVYGPGGYWSKKTQVAYKELSEKGVTNFRSMHNNAAQSYADTLLLSAGDHHVGVKRLLAKILWKIPPFKQLLAAQLRVAKSHIDQLIKLESYTLNNSERVYDLLQKYSICEGQLLGEVDRKSLVYGEMRSHHMIHMLDLLDRMMERVNVGDRSSYLEIGGGFGANVFLMVQNFPNIKKYIYVDIAPNLYVATQFLRANFGSAVCDFSQLEDRGSVSFNNDSNLEIICVLPHQLKDVKTEIDIFHNANSFVEMPMAVACNYATQVDNILSDIGVVLLTSYGTFDKSTTFDPDELCSLFDYDFTSYRETLVFLSEEQRFYIGEKQMKGVVI